MSSRTVPAEAPRRAPPWAMPALAVLALAYSPLAYWAGASGRPPLAVLAALLLGLMLLLEALACRRPWAWLALAALLAALVPLWHSPRALLLLALPPALFTAWAAWFFARSLRRGRQPLVAAIIEALHRQAGMAMTPALYRYGRRVTAMWAWSLALLAAVDAGLALCAVPGGVLARLGHAPRWSVADGTASLFANLLAWGVVGGLMAGEYLLRHRRFAQRPYRDLPDFVRRLGALGPAFWRDLLR